MKNNQAGFTLVEIAIVLVIIGLLLGGVLKGQELINSAKVKNFATDFRNTPLFIYGYQDKYKRLPGDDNGAVARLPMNQHASGSTSDWLAWQRAQRIFRLSPVLDFRRMRMAGESASSRPPQSQT